jgi:hypothetical protein
VSEALRAATALAAESRERQRAREELEGYLRPPPSSESPVSEEFYV